MRVAERAEAHDGPCSLRGCARALPFEHGIVVRVATFAPASVLVLHAFEPRAGGEQPLLVHVDLERPEAAQDLPRAINVVDAPAAIPRAVGFLVIANEI